jgi:hypothetical protein
MQSNTCTTIELQLFTYFTVTEGALSALRALSVMSVTLAAYQRAPQVTTAQAP